MVGFPCRLWPHCNVGCAVGNEDQAAGKYWAGSGKVKVLCAAERLRNALDGG